MRLILSILAVCDAALARPLTNRQEVIYRGICDASAAVSLDAELFAVADDEDNTLRVYRRTEGGAPVYSLDVSAFLKLGRKSPETDLEAAAPDGEVIYWITSHGRNSAGREQPNRQRLFATKSSVEDGRVRLTPIGQPYTRLLKDMLRDPRLRRFDLARASQKAPKLPGALNIEGLAADAQHRLLIGFRNPIPGGKALIVPLLNPAEVIAGASAAFEAPVLIDLDGLGIRSLAFWKGKYLVIAGSFDGTGESRLYEWNGTPGEKPLWIKAVTFPGLNPEALAFGNDADRLEILSDDGSVRIKGMECKKLKDADQKQFRAVWIPVN